MMHNIDSINLKFCYDNSLSHEWPVDQTNLEHAKPKNIKTIKTSSIIFDFAFSDCAYPRKMQMNIWKVVDSTRDILWLISSSDLFFLLNVVYDKTISLIGNSTTSEFHVIMTFSFGWDIVSFASVTESISRQLKNAGQRGDINRDHAYDINIFSFVRDKLVTDHTHRIIQKSSHTWLHWKCRRRLVYHHTSDKVEEQKLHHL